MKRFIINCIGIIGPILGIILVLSFMLHSCFGDKKYTEDYIEKYDDYLSHAFGEYEVIGERYGRLTEKTGVIPIECYTYHISYINDAGIQEDFAFTNIPGDLEESISWHINNYSESIFWEDYIYPYFSNSGFIESSMFMSDVDRYDYDLVDEKLLDPKEGLQFQNFDITSLSKYGLGMTISLHYKFAIDEPWETEEITALFVAMLEQMYQDLHAPDLVGYITFTDDDKTLLFEEEYVITYDEKVGRMIVEELESYLSRKNGNEEAENHNTSTSDSEKV